MTKKYKAVPKSRLSRFGRVARMAAGVASGVVGEGVRQLSQGNRPKMSDLLLTPANARRVAKQLSTMRGAAMKVGQLLSMEASELLPPELADILAQLRDKAFSMPRDQLEQALIDAYGENYIAQFSNFDYNALAAASIGQVHRATTLDGDEIVLKIQYPGIAQSIDSDVNNIASLLKISNLLPKHMDISGLLTDAKKQLHEEADYLKELEHLTTFYELLGREAGFIVPKPYPSLSSKTVLAMEYVDASPIESFNYEDPVQINQLMARLFDLLFREFFELRLMQTDPNFANYQYQAQTQRVVLLDFGATRKFTINFMVNYKRLIRAVMAKDDQAVIDASDLLGYKASEADKAYQALLLKIFYIALEPFSTEGEYDFAKARISERLSELNDDAFSFKKYWQTPPTDILFLHRKLGGLYLLAARLGASVDCNTLIKPWIKTLR